MNIDEKFKILEAIGLSKGEAIEYIEHLNSAVGQVMNPVSVHVDSPLPIVYRDRKGNLWVQPYLDLARVSEVWGVVSGGVCFRRTHDLDTDWRSVCKNLSTYYKFGKNVARFASVEEFEKAFEETALFNQTMALLRKHAIPAEDWKEGGYWTAERQAGDLYAPRFNMGCGKASLYVKSSATGHVRAAVDVPDMK